MQEFQSRFSWYGGMGEILVWGEISLSMLLDKTSFIIEKCIETEITF